MAMETAMATANTAVMTMTIETEDGATDIAIVIATRRVGGIAIIITICRPGSPSAIACPPDWKDNS